MSQMNRRPAPRPGASGRGGAPNARPVRPAPPAAGRSAPRGGRPGGSHRAGGGRMGEVAAIAVAGLIVAVLALALQAHWPNGFPLTNRTVGSRPGAVNVVPEIRSSGPLRINEIMTGNRRTLADASGGSPDWVEIINTSSSAVNLRGWSLAKTDSAASVFTFPDVTLEPQECALVLADSRLRAEAGDALHAPFRLSSSGDTLMLFNPSGTAVDTVNIPALRADESYARASESAWESCAEPTPGFANTPESLQLLSEPSGDSPVLLSEVVAANASALPDENGEYYDYIELFNRSSEAVDLTGWYLSDDAAQPRKWCFPAVELAPGEYLVVHASGLNRRDDPAHLHASFSLSSEGEQAILTDDRGRVMDRTDFGLLGTDEAWSLAADGSWKATAPSPGGATP